MSAAITINTDPTAAAAALAAATKGPGEAQDPGRQHRKALVEKARQEAQSGVYAGTETGSAAPPPTAAEDIPDRNLDSVTFDLPNGMRVEFGPPNGVSLTAKMLAIYQGRDFSVAEEQTTWVMCCLRTVDGKTVTVNNTIDRDKWLQVIGDDGFSILRFVLAKHWPPVRQFDLTIIEKKMR
jgi:hypothetical protein